MVEFRRFGGQIWALGVGRERVPFFIVDRRQIIKSRMTPMGVVVAVAAAEELLPCLGLVVKGSPVDQFTFEDGEEALAQGVVEAVAYRAPGGPDPGLLATGAEGQGGILGWFKESSQHGLCEWRVYDR